MESGIVKFYNNDKGYGFIKQSDGNEIFVHATGLKEEVRQNDNVTFEIQQGKKGTNAINVYKAK